MFNLTTIFILFGVILTSCIFTYDPPSDVDSRMIIRNNSNQFIYYYLHSEDSLSQESGILPYDVFKKEVEGNLMIDTLYNNIIGPGEIDTIQNFRNWETQINSFPDSSLKVYFFERKLLESHKWEEVAQNQLYTLKKKFTLRELQNLGWTITYP